jgi:hypothetical protein
MTVRYGLEAVERVGRLTKNATYDFRIFNSRLPAPMLRVRQGDTGRRESQERAGQRHDPHHRPPCGQWPR